MPENEFEKQAQQKMNELQMVPSEAVWQKLQAQIPAKNEKRRTIWLPVIFICFFLGTSYFLHDLKTKSFSSFNQVAAQKNSNAIVLNSPSEEMISKPIVTTSLVTNRKIEIAKVNTFTTNPTKKNQATVNNIDTKYKHTITAKSLTASHAKNRIVKTNESIKALVVADSASIDDSEINQEKDKITAVVNLNKEKISSNEKDILEAKEKQIVKQKDTVTKINKEEVVSKKVIAKKEKGNKWKYSASFAAGLSSVATGYLGKTANRNFYASNSIFLDQTSSVPLGTTANPNTTFKPSAISPGLSFSIGLSAAKKISNRSDISIGLNYKYLSTSFDVGQSAANAAFADNRNTFAAGNTNKYRNQFHFIELPLNFQTRIGKEKAHSFYGDIGIVISEMISTNALQFNNQSGYYYPMNSLLSKTSFGLSAGLSVNLIKNKNAPLLLGPSFYYSLTPVASTGLYQGTHYGFLGIRLQKYLKRK